MEDASQIGGQKMKKLSEYTVEELLLIYFNQSNVNRQPSFALGSGSIMRNYSDYLYNDDSYSDSDSTIANYTNYDYSNSDYSDSSYGNSLYSEYDAYSGPGGRFYEDYDDYSNYSDYFDYSDYGNYSNYSNYSNHNGYSNSSYTNTGSTNARPTTPIYKAEKTFRQVSPETVRRIRRDDPLFSFWFVAACLALLAIPLVAFILVTSYYNNPTNVSGFIATAIVIGIHLLGFGLGVFIPKMVHHAEFIYDWGYGKDPRKYFSFVVAILLMVAAVALGIVAPIMAASDPKLLGLDKVYPAQYAIMFIGALIYLIISIVIFAYKSNRHKRFEEDLYMESYERERAKHGRFTIVQKPGNYIASIADIEKMTVSPRGSCRIVLKNNKSGAVMDYELICWVEMDDIKFIIVCYASNGKNHYMCYEINAYSDCFYVVDDMESETKLLNLGTDKLNEESKAQGK